MGWERKPGAESMDVAEAKAVLLRHCDGGREDDTLL